MTFENLLIIAKGQNITFQIASYYYHGDKCEITFRNGQSYEYNSRNVSVSKSTASYDPKLYRICHNGRVLFDIASIKEFRCGNTTIWRIGFGNGKIADYNCSLLEISKSVLDDQTAADCLHYLRRVAELNDLTDEEGNRILPEQYRKLENIYNDSVLARYLHPENKDNKIPPPISSEAHPVTPIFPFGCNASQYEAVKRALENSVSVIEGPPGTGKTQTILNLISNLVMCGKTVQIVSNNNAATDNVLEKLAKKEYGFDFFTARLGSRANKEWFLERQTETYPPFCGWEYKGEADLNAEIKTVSEELQTLYQKQQALAEKKSELSALQLEAAHFLAYCKENDIRTEEIRISKSARSNKISAFMQRMEFKKNVSVFTMINGLVFHGIGRRSIYRNNVQSVSDLLKYAFYVVRKKELETEIRDLSASLEESEAAGKEQLLQSLSLLQFRNYLYHRYARNIVRECFTDESIFKKPQAFLTEYPVILSTTFSSLNSVNATFDYVIIDEASQVDLSTGALALATAKNAVVVGDSCQLPFVLSDEKKAIAQDAFKSYRLSESYNYSANSFLDSMKQVFADAPVTMLREHYRCDPAIIEFCNQKFYHGKLMNMTESTNDAPLTAIRTVAGDHARGHFNQRQIDVIVREILPSLPYSPDDIGVIAPYNEQISKLTAAIDNEAIQISTVHKFQGRERKVIIFSTVDNQIRAFTDDPKLLNVAVSRAIEKFILVIGNDAIGDGNIADLVSYIAYHNLDIKESQIYSVFDLLYETNTAERLKFLSAHKRISDYDSENLMYGCLSDILQNHPELKIACHVPLRLLIKDKTSLNIDELRYVTDARTHVDFLIYKKVSKSPVLIVEVDGYYFHKEGTAQTERDKMKNAILQKYALPLIRLSTVGSEEKKKIETLLTQVI